MYNKEKQIKKSFPTKKQFIRGIRYAILRKRFKDLINKKSIDQDYIDYLKTL